MNPEKRRRRSKLRAKQNRKQRSRGKDRFAAFCRGDYEITEKGMRLIE